jgi:hypothetical protein
MSESQNDNVMNKPPKVGDIDVSEIDDKVDIHSTSDSARHLASTKKRGGGNRRK